MLIQLSLSPLTIRNLHSFDGSPSQAIEWLVRSYATNGFPAPYIVNDRSAKQIVTVKLTPYTIEILRGFAQFGMNPSQVVEWLLVSYLNEMKKAEPPAEPKPKPIKVKQPKQQPTKHAYVRTQTNGPVTKKVKKIKPVR